MNKIFCYSATGNSYATAKILAKQLDAEIIHITRELCKTGLRIETKLCIIVYPVYAYGVPKTVKRWIKQSFFDAEYTAVIATVGSKAGGAHAEAIRLLKRRKCTVDYTTSITSVENFVHLFKLPSQERIKELCENQMIKTVQVADDIKSRAVNKRFLIRPASALVSFWFRRATRLFARRYRILDQCSGCGVCYAVCPALAIEMRPREVTVEVLGETAPIAVSPSGQNLMMDFEPASKAWETEVDTENNNACSKSGDCQMSASKERCRGHCAQGTESHGQADGIEQCRTKAIKLRPKIISAQCDHCQACLQLCPRKAIRFGRVKPGGRRYIHPDVMVGELYKRNRV